MKIAFYCSSRVKVPHNPSIVSANTDVMVNIINELNKRKKYNITLYASKGSKLNKTKIIDLGLSAHNLDSAFNKAEWIKNVYTAYILRYLTQMVKDSNQYDLLHLHEGKLYMGMPFALISQCPVLLTIHQQLDKHEQTILENMPEAYLVSVSNAQRKIIPNLNYVQTIYHGIDTKEFIFDSYGSNNFIFLSRISPEKGVEDAIEAVRKNNDKLNIIGPGESEYLKKAVLDNIDKNITYKGVVKYKSKLWYQNYQKSKALLFPIKWDEPFGLVMIEAMACGTPVIAYDRGSVSEIIKNNITGYIVNPKEGINGFAKAIKKLNSLSEQEYQQMRLNCRKHVEENFTIEKMVDKYEEVYKKVIAEHKKKNK